MLFHEPMWWKNTIRKRKNISWLSRKFVCFPVSIGFKTSVFLYLLWCRSLFASNISHTEIPAKASYISFQLNSLRLFKPCLTDLKIQGSERVEEFKYLGTTLTIKNSIQEEIKSRLKLGNACYYSVQNLLSSSLLSKNVKIRYIEL